MAKHDPYITVGRKWAILPACSCGWIGSPCDDKGEAIRKAVSHARNISHTENCTESRKEND